MSLRDAVQMVEAAKQAGAEVCCPIHDAFLVRFPLAEEIDVIATTTKLMVDASAIVMGPGYACRVDADIVRVLSDKLEHP